MSSAIHTDTPAAPEYVSDATVCVSCGYSIAGLRVDAKCPECGTRLERSIPRLHYLSLSPRARAWMITGLNTMLVVLIATIVLRVFEILTVFEPSDYVWRWAGREYWALSILSPALMAIHLLGAFLFATTPIGIGAHAVADSGRRSFRLITVAMATVLGIVVYLHILRSLGASSPRFPNDRDGQVIAISVIVFILQVLLMAHIWATCRYSVWMFRCVADVAGARWAGRLRWLLPAILLGGLVGGMLIVMNKALITSLGIMAPPPVGVPNPNDELIPILYRTVALVSQLLAAVLLWLLLNRLRLRMATVEGASLQRPAVA